MRSTPPSLHPKASCAQKGGTAHVIAAEVQKSRGGVSVVRRRAYSETRVTWFVVKRIKKATQTDRPRTAPVPKVLYKRESI